MDRFARCHAAGSSMLDDRNRRAGKLADHGPSYIRVGDITVRQFLALQLFGAGQLTLSEGGGIERPFLMWVFAVAQGPNQVKGQTHLSREGALTKGSPEVLTDDAVVVGGGQESLGGEPLP